MPPKATTAVSVPRHQWTIDERDALRILFHEYDLDSADGQNVAFQIFDDMFTWDRGLVPTLVKVRDEYRNRDKWKKSMAWVNIHVKAYTAYTNAEQTNRALVRVRILQSAQSLGITLTPLAGDADAMALHAAGLITASAAGVGGLPTHAGGTAPPAPPAPAHTTQPSQQPAAGPSSRTALTTRQDNSARQGATATPEESEDDDILYMVHQLQGGLFTSDDGIASLSWTRGEMFGPESDIWNIWRWGAPWFEPRSGPPKGLTDELRSKT